VGGRLERNKAIKKAIGIALLQAWDHFIDPNKSIIIRFHDVLCRNNFCLQNSNRQKEGYIKFLIGFVFCSTTLAVLFSERTLFSSHNKSA
jgi:hypothetical protein